MSNPGLSTEATCIEACASLCPRRTTAALRRTHTAVTVEPSAGDRSLRPITVEVPEADLADLRVTRFPERETVDNDSQGVPPALMQDRKRHCATEHDWGKSEARLNAVPSFMSEIDALAIHFVHVRSKHEEALPLVVCHGWPHSIVEQMKLLGPLTDPTAHGASASDAFHVVIFSMPAYGFSGKPTTVGWGPVRIDKAYVELMRRLGYLTGVTDMTRGTDGSGWDRSDAPLDSDEGVCTALVLAARRGQETRVLELGDASFRRADGEGIAVADYALAVLYNGLGRYETALAAARRSCAHEDWELFPWAVAELAEASARSGAIHVAVAAVRRLDERAPADRTDSALGVQARSHALLNDHRGAELFYRESIERLGGSRIGFELARTQLLYGEWLRRRSRRVDARKQLRAAHATFSHLGAVGFGERALRELVATGETVRKRSVDTRYALTAQERLIARLAGEGYTNREIGTNLFLSPRTVEWHLGKVFTKLGVCSRRSLREALPDDE